MHYGPSPDSWAMAWRLAVSVNVLTYDSEALIWSESFAHSPGAGRHRDVLCEKWFPNLLVPVGQAFGLMVFVPLKTGLPSISYATRLLE
ncbi:hypothetical protein A6X21_09845 [Planctopirus hydrillae]|uniref:Uncharacterized protein n=1 Tax=Planctopirus hydrillae TaxID=1841610 RepID=A0A1C3E793_9PLAN|nr:hypothetical protein A6X21_09845 [Planctopirus hydrillae]